MILKKVNITVSNSCRIVEQLIKGGAKLDVRSDDGKTALIYAAITGDICVANLLIKNGADASIVDKDGKPAQIYAAEQGHTDMVHLLQVAGSVYPEANNGGIGSE